MSAYENKNGTTAIPIINAAHYTYNATINLGEIRVKRMSVFLTDNNHNVSLVERSELQGSSFKLFVEERAMKTLWLE